MVPQPEQGEHGSASKEGAGERRKWEEEWEEFTGPREVKWIRSKQNQQTEEGNKGERDKNPPFTVNSNKSWENSRSLHPLETRPSIVQTWKSIPTPGLEQYGSRKY